MARIFLSHSSQNNAEAVALKDWLTGQGWDDLFLDLDPVRGIAAGERWERALYRAADRCEAVIFLVSRAWLSSRWCLKELHLAQKLNKRLFGVLVEDLSIADLPQELTGAWQLVGLAGGSDHKLLHVLVPGAEEAHVTFSESGLKRLKAGLLRAGLDPRYFGWPPPNDPQRAPYRGLRALEAEDAGIFFGREASIIAGLDRLRGLKEAAPPRVLAILGASGAGKSSYLRAGLLARLARDDRSFLPLPPIRPERAAISGETGLLRVLEQALRDKGLIAARAALKEAASGGAGPLLQTLARLVDKAQPPAIDGDTQPTRPTVVLPIDQAEELFQAEGAAEATQLLALLRALALADAPGVILLFAIRSDAFEQLQSAPALEGLQLETLSLPPMPRGAYQQVIEGPAQRVTDSGRALRVEPALTQRLLTDIDDGGAKDALPLLAFTLERLYLEYGGDSDLKASEYEQLGGIKGSIDAAVSAAMKAADADPAVPRDAVAREALLRRALIPWLAGIDPDSGSPRRRVARMSEIPAEAHPLVRHLIAARLLSTDRSAATGDVTIEPVHEALLRQWGLLQGWLEEDFAALATLEGTKRAARDWAANARDGAWLAHAAGRLDDAEALLSREDLARSLDATDRAYLAAARSADKARRDRELEEARKLAEAQREAADRQRQVARRTRIGLVAASVLAVAAAGAAFYGFDQSREAEKNAANLAVSVALAAIDRAENDEAARLLLRAAEAYDDETAPDEIQIAFHRLNEALSSEVLFPLPAGSRPVEFPEALYFIDEEAGDVLRFDGHGPPETVVDASAEDPAILHVRGLDDGSLVLVRADGSVFRSQAGEQPQPIGTVAIATERELGEDEQQVSIAADGTVLVTRSLLQPLLQLLDTSTGLSYAGNEKSHEPVYVSVPGKGRYLVARDISRVVQAATTLSLEPVAAADDERLLLRTYACFARGNSLPPRDNVAIEFSDTGFGERCVATPDGVLLTYFSGTSAGTERVDKWIRPGEGTLRIKDIVATVSSYGERDTISWIGYEPSLSALVALVNQDVLVFDEYQLLGVRKHPVTLGPARLLGDGRIGVIEQANNRISVHELARGSLRGSLVRNRSGLPDLLNRGTCVGYGLRMEDSLPFGTVSLPGGATAEFGGSTSVSGEGPPTVTVTRDGERKTIALGTEDACVQLSSDAKRLVLTVRGGPVRVLDFSKVLSGSSMDEALLGEVPGWNSAFPVGEGTEVITDYEGAVYRWRQGSDGTWESAELYRGEFPVFYAEPDSTGARLLLIEWVGAGEVRGFYYSTLARERWLELGSDYKWFGAAFGRDGEIAFGARAVEYVAELPTLGALVAETRMLRPGTPP